MTNNSSCQVLDANGKKCNRNVVKTIRYHGDGALVLDCCAGSGTTAIACLNTNRNYICIEKEQKYFDIMNDRIAKVMKPLETFS